MEIKIFNQKVNCCGDCHYYGSTPHFRKCNVNVNLSIGYSINTIHKDCPFLQQVNRKNIESLGFKYFGNKEDSPEIDLYYFAANSNTYLLFISDKSISLYFNSEHICILNSLAVDNFEHLKFVLSLTELKDLLTWK